LHKAYAYHLQKSFKKVAGALERNEDLELDVRKHIEEYISIFADVLIPLIRQSVPLQELEDYLMTPETMNSMNLFSPFMPEGKTIRDEVDRYLSVSSEPFPQLKSLIPPYFSAMRRFTGCRAEE